VILRVRIGADLEQSADERQRAVVDRIPEAPPDCERHGPIRHAVRIVDRRPQRSKVANAKRGIDLLELVVLCAPLCV